MSGTGLLAGLLAKVSGAGTAAKAAMAGVTAVATMGVAGAAGVLPAPAQNVVASAVNAATPFEIPDAGGVTGIIEHVGGALPQVPVTVAVPGAPPVSVAAGAKTGDSAASAPNTLTPPANVVPPVSVPNVAGGVPPLPQVTVPPAVAGLVKGLPACVGNLIPTGGGVPDPAKLATQIPACIPQVLATPGLPPEVARCVASVLAAIGGASGMASASVANVGSLNVSSCVPMDTSKCVTNSLGLLAGLPGAGGIPGIGTVPGVTSVTGCVPMNVTACITSITNAVAAGTAPKLDLSACMPALTPPALPGVGGLPGLGGALPFLGR